MMFNQILAYIVKLCMKIPPLVEAQKTSLLGYRILAIKVLGSQPLT